VVAVLAWLAMPFNDGFYESFVNYDPQGDAQQYEWVATRWIFRYTSGVLCGQFVAVVAGVALARRHRHLRALLFAAPLGVLLAGATVAVAFPLAGSFPAGSHPPPLTDPVLVRLLWFELAAYPLWAVAGVGVGVLAGRRRLLLAGLGVAWWIAAAVGLLQTETYGWTAVVLPVLPPLAASTAITLAGLSMDPWADPPVPDGDWGRGASLALVCGLIAYALALNLASPWVRGHLRRRDVDVPG